MSDKVECGIHGQQHAAFVCSHLAEPSVAAGFNWSEEDDSGFPDAWCDNCEVIRSMHNGWNEESEKLAGISSV